MTAVLDNENSWKSPQVFISKIYQDLLIYPILLIGNSLVVIMLLSNEYPDISSVISDIFLGIFIIILFILLSIIPLSIYYDIKYVKLIQRTQYKHFNVEDFSCSQILTEEIYNVFNEVSKESWLDSSIKRRFKKIIPISEVIRIIDKDIYIGIGTTYKDIDNIRKTPIYIGPHDEQEPRLLTILQIFIDKSLGNE